MLIATGITQKSQTAYFASLLHGERQSALELILTAGNMSVCHNHSNVNKISLT